MRIVIISGTAPPEPLTASMINWDLADHLAAQKHEVWLISPKPSRPLGVKYHKLPGIITKKAGDNFYHVNVDSFTYPEYNLFLRAYESLDFGIRSTRFINKEIKDYDMIYASSWPFFSQLMIVLLRRNKNLPLIMNIQDLYPESFFTKIKSKVLTWFLKPLCLIDKKVAQKSTHITVISESLRQVYLNKRGIPESKVSVNNNWQDQEEFCKTLLSRAHIIEKYNLELADGKFIYMYLGNIGPVAGVDTIINAFAKLDNENLFLIIAGAGSSRDKCQALVKKLDIDCVAFISVPSGLKNVAELQSISDILLLPLDPEAANSSVPSKLIAYMFSGKPVITSASEESETAKAIRVSGCGWITGTNHTDDWAHIMESAFNTDETVLNEMGRTGCTYALLNYSKTEGLRKISELIYRISEK